MSEFKGNNFGIINPNNNTNNTNNNTNNTNNNTNRTTEKNNLTQQKKNQEIFKQNQLAAILDEFSRHLKNPKSDAGVNNDIVKVNFGVREFPRLLEFLKEDKNMLLIEKKLALIDFFQQTLDNYKISNQDISNAAENFLKKIKNFKNSFNKQKSLKNLSLNQYLKNKQNVEKFLLQHNPSKNFDGNNYYKLNNVVQQYEIILQTIIENFSLDKINSSLTIIKPVQTQDEKKSVETTDIFRENNKKNENKPLPYVFTPEEKLSAALQKLELNDISNFIILFLSFYFSIVRDNYAAIKKYLKEKDKNKYLANLVLKKNLYNYIKNNS